jgi:hypothetical protein
MVNNKHKYFHGNRMWFMGQGSVVSISTCYGLDGPWIKYWPSRPPVQWLLGLFPGAWH